MVPLQNTNVFSESLSTSFDISIIMFIRSIIFVCTTAIVFLLGYACGEKTTEAKSKELAIVANSENTINILQNTNENLVEHQKQDERTSTFRVTTIHRLAALATVGAKNNRRYHCPIIEHSKSTKLSEEFIHIFGLTENEASAINSALENARTEMEKLAMSMQEATYDPAQNCITIQYPASPQIGGQIYDQTNSDIRRTLGPEREKYFDMFSADDFDRQFDSFSTVERTISVTLDVDESGNTLYKIIEVAGNSTGTSKLFLEGLKSHYPTIAALVTSKLGSHPFK